MTGPGDEHLSDIIEVRSTPEEEEEEDNGIHHVEVQHPQCPTSNTEAMIMFVKKMLKMVALSTRSRLYKYFCLKRASGVSDRRTRDQSKIFHTSIILM